MGIRKITRSSRPSGKLLRGKEVFNMRNTKCQFNDPPCGGECCPGGTPCDGDCNGRF